MTLAESVQALVSQVAKIGGETGGLLGRITALEDEVSRLRKQVMPFYWQTVTLQFTNGTASSVNLSTFLVNPYSLAVTYTVKSGALPSGCTLSGSTVSYNGTGAAGASVVAFSATSGSYVADSANVTATIASAPQGNRAPVWSVADNFALTPAATAGTATNYSVAPYASDPDSNPLTFSRTGGTAPAGVTVNTAGTISVPTSVSAGTYTVTVQADDGQNNALADWQARSSRSSVVWAHRFSATDTSGDYWLRQGESSSAVASRLSTGGIIGDGCLQVYVPQGQTPGNAGWGRPLAPVQASASLGIQADANPKGLPALPMDTFFSYQGNEGFKKLANMRGGCFGNATYFDSTQYYPGVPEFVWSGQFWFQFRVKVNAARLLGTEHAGKLFILDHNSGGTAMGELVTGFNADRNSNWPAGMYFYTSQGNYANSELTGPQGGVGGSQYLPGSTYTACTYGNGSAANCWSMKPDTWYTFNYGITPGRQSVTTDGGYTWTQKYFDAGVIVKVAEQGATSWTTLINKSDYWWWYDANWDNGIPEQWGWAGQKCPNAFNEIRFSFFNGGPYNLPVLNDCYLWLDQILLDTAEPLLPN